MDDNDAIDSFGSFEYGCDDDFARLFDDGPSMPKEQSAPFTPPSPPSSPPPPPPIDMSIPAAFIAPPRPKASRRKLEVASNYFFEFEDESQRSPGRTRSKCRCRVCGKEFLVDPSRTNNRNLHAANAHPEHYKMSRSQFEATVEPAPPPPMTPPPTPPRIRDRMPEEFRFRFPPFPPSDYLRILDKPMDKITPADRLSLTDYEKKFTGPEQARDVLREWWETREEFKRKAEKEDLEEQKAIEDEEKKKEKKKKMLEVEEKAIERMDESMRRTRAERVSETLREMMPDVVEESDREGAGYFASVSSYDHLFPATFPPRPSKYQLKKHHRRLVEDLRKELNKKVPSAQRIKAMEMEFVRMVNRQGYFQLDAGAHTSDKSYVFLDVDYSSESRLGYARTACYHISHAFLSQHFDGYTLPVFQSFETVYENGVKKIIGVNTKEKNLGTFWASHIDRAQVSRLQFNPKKPPGFVPDVVANNQLSETEFELFNTWRGLPFIFWDKQTGRPWGLRDWERELGYRRVLEPVQLFLNHIWEVFVKKDEKLYHYVIGMMARKIVCPADPIGIMLIVIGLQGIGKSLLFEIFSRLFGSAGIVIQRTSQIFGTFGSSYFDDKVFAVLDEFEPLALNAEKVCHVKSLSTGLERDNHSKFKTPGQVLNHLTIAASSNSYSMPTELLTRRSCYLEASSRYMSSKSYFNKFGQAFDLTVNFDEAVRNLAILTAFFIDYTYTTRYRNWVSVDIPRSAEHVFTQVANMSPLQKWWWTVLQLNHEESDLPPKKRQRTDNDNSQTTLDKHFLLRQQEQQDLGGWDPKPSFNSLFDSFKKYLTRVDQVTNETWHQFSRQFIGLLPPGCNIKPPKDRYVQINLPPFSACRNHFIKTHRLDSQYSLDLE